MKGVLGIDGELISGIWKDIPDIPGAEVIDLEGRILMAGGIDAHVHFREPGMTWKADIGSESAAAVLGGITSFIDMPNNSPPATTMEAIEWKLGRAKETSAANYGFHIGATNSNASLIREWRFLKHGQVFHHAIMNNILNYLVHKVYLPAIKVVALQVL